jgi:hypothetical protein
MRKLTLAPVAIVLAISPLAFSAEVGGDSKNPANNWLLRASPADQAAQLGKSVGEGCVGKTAFYRGSTPDHTAAFWDIRCTNGRSYGLMVRPDGDGKVVECELLEAIGDHCFRKLPGR